MNLMTQFRFKLPLVCMVFMLGGCVSTSPTLFEMEEACENSKIKKARVSEKDTRWSLDCESD